MSADLVRGGDPLTVACEALGAEGEGLAHVGGLRVHAAGLLPGETGHVALTHVSPHVHAGVREAWGLLVGLDAHSADRVSPVCPGFGTCGGCPLQHLSYEAQLRWKSDQAARALAPVLPQGIAVAPCLPSPRPLGYRNHAKYVFGPGAVLGAYATRSHTLLDLAGCRLIEPPLEAAARVLRDVLGAARVRPYDERTRTGLLRHVVLRANAEGRVLVTLVTARDEWPEGTALAARARDICPEIIGVVQNINDSTGNVIFGDREITLAGQDVLEDQIAGVRVRLASRAFFQVNRAVAALAYEAIAAAAAEIAPARALDLFCGVGAIALVLAGVAGEVLGVEQNAAATEAAEAAARAAGVSNVRFETGDAAGVTAALDRASAGSQARGAFRPDFVVVNPPRTGCAPALLDALGPLSPARLAYLSCNPRTLARDLARLAALGYRPRSVQPLDMHPHTPHIEVLAVLDRGTAGGFACRLERADLHEDGERPSVGAAVLAEQVEERDVGADVQLGAEANHGAKVDGDRVVISKAV